MATNKINFNLRIDEEINKELRIIAEEEGRSKNAQIEYILKDYIKKYRSKIEKEEKGTTIEQQNINYDSGTQNINYKKKR